MEQFTSWWKSLTSPGQAMSEEMLTRNVVRQDNLPEIELPNLPENPDSSDPQLWYPNRVQDSRLEKARMKTVGYYKNHFPEGAIIHFTAGRSRNSKMGGKRNLKSHFEMGIQETLTHCKEQKFSFFVIDRDGNVYQQFPLDRWGYHAGESSWPGLHSTVSNELVGIEVMCAGQLSRIPKTMQFKAWFTDLKKGDLPFSYDEVSEWGDVKNVKAGAYHRFTAAQIQSLKDLLIWMKNAAPNECFKLDYVLGHDEVAPSRKSDPGGSLGMTMEDFREKLKEMD
jgi:hypothetical protein